MTDITNNNLEAALLDQKVAGAMGEKPYAYTVVYNDGWALGIAVKNESGYHPIAGKTFGSEGEAREWADGLNKHIGLVPRDVIQIVTSSMQKDGKPDLSRW